MVAAAAQQLSSEVVAALVRQKVAGRWFCEAIVVSILNPPGAATAVDCDGTGDCDGAGDGNATGIGEEVTGVVTVWWRYGIEGKEMGNKEYRVLVLLEWPTYPYV